MNEDRAMPLVEHLVELRRRLIASLWLLLAGSLLVYRWSGDMLTWLARPVGGLVFNAPTDAFYTRCKVAVFGGFLLALPLILHQVWLFIGCAMEDRLRKPLLRILPISYFLFLGGAALAVFVVVPGAMHFLLAYGSDEIRPLLTLSAYLQFVTGLALAFGLMFQMPLVLYFLNQAGVVSREQLSSRRQYIYLLSFIAAGLMTPGPDVFSQLALGVPSIVLFEITLFAMS